MLNGKRILVTGSSRGIGAEIVKTLHSYGAEVVIHYSQNSAAAEKLQAQLGDRAHLVQSNLMQLGTAPDLWNDAVAQLGAVDVLVNNAGAWIDSPVSDQNEWQRGWDENIQLNLQAPADLCREAIDHFSDNGGGIIINIVSRSAHRGDDADHLAYGAAKGGLLALTRGIARGFAHENILAYAIAPAWVKTELAADVDLTSIEAALPMREVTPPSDVAEFVAFLASGKSRHSTGTTIDITGADYVR